MRCDLHLIRVLPQENYSPVPCRTEVNCYGLTAPHQGWPQRTWRTWAKENGVWKADSTFITGFSLLGLNGKWVGEERRGTGDRTNYKRIRTPCVTKYPSLNNLNSPLLHQKWGPQIPLCKFTNYTPSPGRCVAYLLRNLHFRISKNHLITHYVVGKQLASTVQQWAAAFRVYI